MRKLTLFFSVFLLATVFPVPGHAGGTAGMEAQKAPINLEVELQILDAQGRAVTKYSSSEDLVWVARLKNRSDQPRQVSIPPGPTVIITVTETSTNRLIAQTFVGILSSTHQVNIDPQSEYRFEIPTSNVRNSIDSLLYPGHYEVESSFAIENPDCKSKDCPEPLLTFTSKAFVIEVGSNSKDKFTYSVSFKKEVSALGAEDSERQTAAEALLGDVAKKYNGEVIDIYVGGIIGGVMKLSPSAASMLRKDPRVKAVEENKLGTLDEIQNLAFWVIPRGNWGLDRIDQPSLPLDKLYDYGDPGSTPVHVYILDQGGLDTHKEFDKNRMILEKNFHPDYTDSSACVGNPDRTNYRPGHGTAVAGIIGGKDVGVAKNAILHVSRVANCGGLANPTAVWKALAWVKANAKRPAVVNLSLSVSLGHGLVEGAVEDLLEMGIPVVTSAGNFHEGITSPDACTRTPGNLRDLDPPEQIIVVSGTDRWDRRFTGSVYGPCTNIFAPGESIRTASHITKFSYKSITGTSAAAPFVTGVVALYLSHNKDATTDDVYSAIVDKLSVKGKVNIRPNSSHGLSSTPNRLLQVYRNEDPEPDGIKSIDDNCPVDSNPSQTDSDGDGVGDACDNAINFANEDQQDTDGDGDGDVTDPDIDNDLVLNGSDNCPTVYNEAPQSDADLDGLGDECDSCPGTPIGSMTDTDTDGVPDCADVCDDDPNPDQDDVCTVVDSVWDDNSVIFNLGSWSFDNGNRATTGLATGLQINGGYNPYFYQTTAIGNDEAVVPVSPLYFDAPKGLLVNGNKASSTISLNSFGASYLKRRIGGIQITYGYTVMDDNQSVIHDITFYNNDTFDDSFKYYILHDLDTAFTPWLDVVDATVDGFVLSNGGVPEWYWSLSEPATKFELGSTAFTQVDGFITSGTAGDLAIDEGSVGYPPTFGPGDYVGAYQFDIDLIAGESKTISIVIGTVDSGADGDAIPDLQDNADGVFNPKQEDSDGDGIGDVVDNCPDIASADQTDLDGDGLGAPCDLCDNDDSNDIDYDGFCGLVDNCPENMNFDQTADADSDGTGDACDICPGTDDAIDTDSDGVPDGCDQCPGFDDQLDLDFDGVPDGCDLCPNTFNRDSSFTIDTNGDGIGDGCQCGDVNGDGAANNDDVTEIYMVLWGYSAYLQPGNNWALCDVSGDGNCNNDDITEILLPLWGYEAYSSPLVEWECEADSACPPGLPDTHPSYPACEWN